MGERVNVPPAGMEAPGPPGPAGPRDSAGRGGRTGLVPAPAPPGRAGARGPGWAAGALERLDLESWVREKVLFLLDPRRGQHAAEAPDQGAAGLPGARGGGGAWGGLTAAPRPPRALGTPGPAPAAAPARGLLVRVEDYRETREVVRAAGARGRATACTEERALTAVTFRAGRD
ncbi:uncharacterized protein C6orf141 homolog [Dipodomys spectabilis]|uniref:uncharacterized protein C6orf141 homolog n=1 Tax=Dipodomys spectabilis TaxID=105255 RepID=UPI001C54640A|nr:uncharacterized protein C6orf141 homolog [Dipodomys spectabilis]